MKIFKRGVLLLLGVVVLVELLPVNWGLYSLERECSWDLNYSSKVTVHPEVFTHRSFPVYPRYDEVERFSFSSEDFQREEDFQDGMLVNLVSIHGDEVSFEGGWTPFYKKGSFQRKAEFNFPVRLTRGCDEAHVNIDGSIDLVGSYAGFGLLSRQIVEERLKDYSAAIIRAEVEKKILEVLEESL